MCSNDFLQAARGYSLCVGSLVSMGMLPGGRGRHRAVFCCWYLYYRPFKSTVPLLKEVASATLFLWGLQQWKPRDGGVKYKCFPNSSEQSLFLSFFSYFIDYSSLFSILPSLTSLKTPPQWNLNCRSFEVLSASDQSRAREREVFNLCLWGATRSPVSCLSKALLDLSNQRCWSFAFKVILPGGILCID